MVTTSWTVEIDREREGDFNGTNADVTSYVMDADCFVGMRQPYEDIASDTMLKIKMNNADRRVSAISISAKN